jgi:hypothetical protein
MPIVKEPKPLPSPLDYVPPQGDPYKVKSGDSWYTLAERPEVKGAGMTARDLCFFNFRTLHPPEINWYLHRKVGCQMFTREGKNYIFTSSDKPGIVYLPKIGPKPPVTELSPKKNQERFNAWFGLVGKAGTMFAVVGIETVAGYVASLDDVGKGIAVAASINRLGVGVGVSGGLSFILITGVKSPNDLNGYQQLDKDFNLALGENWGKMGKAAAKVKKLSPLVQAIIKTGAKTPGALKKILAAEPDKWVELVKAAKAVKDYGEIDPRGDPNVFMFDVPLLGVGTEASAFYGLANFNAVWDFTE